MCQFLNKYLKKTMDMDSSRLKCFVPVHMRIVSLIQSIKKIKIKSKLEKLTETAGASGVSGTAGEVWLCEPCVIEFSIEGELCITDCWVTTGLLLWVYFCRYDKEYDVIKERKRYFPKLLRYPDKIKPFPWRRTANSLLSWRVDTCISSWILLLFSCINFFNLGLGFCQVWLVLILCLDWGCSWCRHFVLNESLFPFSWLRISRANLTICWILHLIDLK